MIVTSLTQVNARDVSKYAWSNLRRYHNVKYVRELHTYLNNVPAKYKRFAEKQAQQIRHCLIQAREYAEAAERVTLATKPVLLYYSCLSLAYAEILMKQDGQSSLDMARKAHAHHGLSLKVDEEAASRTDDLITVASAMKAVPKVGAGGARFGTFELWRRSARGLPAIGRETMWHPDMSQTSRYNVMFTPGDQEPDLIAEHGLSLLEALSHVAGLSEIVAAYGGPLRFVRGRIERNLDAVPGPRQKFRNAPNVTIIVHPGPPELIDSWMDSVQFKMPAVDEIEMKMFGGGGALTVNIDVTPFDAATIPQTTNINTNSVLFYPGSAGLNEFGYIYISLYILGNFARYYPDLWMKAVELSHPIALVAEQFIELVESRMPLATLSEMSRSYHVVSEEIR